MDLKCNKTIKTEVIRMKKKLILISVLLVGLLAVTGCSKPSNKSETEKNNNHSSTDKGATDKKKSNSKDDALGSGEIKESDIVSKTKEHIGGQDVIKYELKDGSMMVVPEGEDDLDKINDAIKKDKKGGTKEIL